MAKKPARHQPTDGELEILELLWRIGPATVRQVHEARNEDGSRKVGYTTVLKLMQIMADKGLVRRDTSSRSHIYEPVDSSETTQHELVQDLIDRAFAGSAAQLVQRALSHRKATASELQELRQLLKRLEEGESL